MVNFSLYPWVTLLSHSSATIKGSGCHCPAHPPQVQKAQGWGSAVTGKPCGAWHGTGFTRVVHSGPNAQLQGALRIHHGVALGEAATRQLSCHVPQQQLSHTLQLAISRWVAVRRAVASRQASVEFVTPTCSGSNQVWTAPRLRSTALFWLVRKDLLVFIIHLCELFFHHTSWLPIVCSRINNVCFLLETMSLKNWTVEMRMECPPVHHLHCLQPDSGLCLLRVSPCHITPM